MQLLAQASSAPAKSITLASLTDLHLQQQQRQQQEWGWQQQEQG